MNTFDAVVYVGLIVAIGAGFRAGLLRSAITILGYLLAMPIAAWIMSLPAPSFALRPGPLTQNSVLFFGTFLIAGMVLGKLLRSAIDETMGAEAGIGDRLAGAALGGVRLVLVAVTMVAIFDQLVPVDRQPPFLTDSRLRPLLSDAGRHGFRSLPPDVTAYIDRLKQQERI